MAKFIPGTDTTVRAADALLEVQATPATPLRPGKHVFELVVTDDSGNESAPAKLTIIVQDQSRPTAVIDALRDDGSRNPDPVVTVSQGKSFKLTGDRSSDLGGRVVSWTWKLLPG